MTLRLIVGLGNPGPEYRDTRHNVGFMILDRLAAREDAPFRRERRWKAEVAQAGSTLLCKPLTFMNLSGESVRPLSSFYKIEPAEILVVLDDMALPLGRLRIRPSGSAGGHNGLQSIIENFGAQAIPRLRVGIGAAQGEAIGHVLGRFALDEAAPLEQSLARAMDAIDCARSQGLAAAMNAYNKNPAPPQNPETPAQS
jgi:PTH1 family peptidyl-tRNA hydrolase